MVADWLPRQWAGCSCTAWGPIKTLCESELCRQLFSHGLCRLPPPSVQLDAEKLPHHTTLFVPGLGSLRQTLMYEYAKAGANSKLDPSSAVRFFSLCPGEVAPVPTFPGSHQDPF